MDYLTAYGWEECVKIDVIKNELQTTFEMAQAEDTAEIVETLAKAEAEA